MFKFIVGIAALLFIVMIVGGISSIGSSVNHDQKTSDRVAANWDQVQVGMTEDQVSSILGPPDNTQNDVMSNPDPLSGSSTTTSDVWTYGTLATTSYIVSFTDGTVDSKSSG